MKEDNVVLIINKNVLEMKKLGQMQFICCLRMFCNIFLGKICLIRIFISMNYCFCSFLSE